jgi:acetamidase/formamidase
MSRKIRALLPAVLALAALPASAKPPKIDHHVPLTPATAVFGNFPIQKAAILTVPSGAVVRIDTGGGAGWRAENRQPDEWLAAHQVGVDSTFAPIRESIEVWEKAERYAGIQGGHYLVGPINIEGAEPGDTLEVRVFDVVPRIPYGTTGVGPGRSLKGNGEGPRKPSHVTRLDLKRKVGRFLPDVDVPLAPFMGVMGVQPSAEYGDNYSSSPPGRFGGNLDCRELGAGSTLYLPVWHAGARFFTGDSHAAQGDGEISGTAIETANTVTVQFILHKGWKLSMPRAETPTHYIAFGLDADLENAMQQAVDEAVSYINDVTGWQGTDRAIPLASMGVDFRVTQVVDHTKGIHAMIPKSLFKNLPRKNSQKPAGAPQVQP